MPHFCCPSRQQRRSDEDITRRGDPGSLAGIGRRGRGGHAAAAPRLATVLRGRLRPLHQADAAAASTAATTSASAAAASTPTATSSAAATASAASTSATAGGLHGRPDHRDGRWASYTLEAVGCRTAWVIRRQSARSSAPSSGRWSSTSTGATHSAWCRTIQQRQSRRLLRTGMVVRPLDRTDFHGAGGSAVTSFVQAQFKYSLAWFQGGKAPWILINVHGDGTAETGLGMTAGLSQSCCSFSSCCSSCTSCSRTSARRLSQTEEPCPAEPMVGGGAPGLRAAAAPVDLEPWRTHSHGQPS